MCHLAKHLGRAGNIGRGEQALAHLAKVNGWSRKKTAAYEREVRDKWGERSQHEYTLNVDYLYRYLLRSKVHLDWLDKSRNWFGNRLESVVWANEVLKSDALVLDTETTGLLKDHPEAEVIELAVVDMKGKVLYNQLFRPRFPIPQRTIKIHGIRNRDVKSAPGIATEMRQIRKLLTGRTVVTYNAKFDRDVIDNTCYLHELRPIDCRWECAMQAYWTLVGQPYLPLPGGKHRALADARAALKLIRQMAKADM